MRIHQTETGTTQRGTRQPFSSRFFWKLPRPLVASVLSLASVAVLQAQEPFAQDIVPTFSFSESYVEVVKSQTEEGVTEYLVVPNAESKLTVAAKLSSSGIDFSTFTAETPITITVGDFEVAGVLGDDPNYQPGATSVRIPVMDEDAETGEPIEVGRAVVSWNNKEINASVTVKRPETYQVAASYYLGLDEKIDDTTTCQFLLGDYALTDRTVYVKGKAGLRNKTVGSGENAEEFELYSVEIAGAIDSIRPKVRTIGLVNNEIVDSAEFAFEVVASDNSLVYDVQVQLNDEEYTSIYEDEETGRWLADGLELTYGTNRIRVKAIDEDGNESLVAESAVRYWAPLVINIAGKGSVTKGFNGTTLREPGARFSVKATPADGYIFAGWSGGIVSSSPTLSFEMQPGLALTANFVPNPFLATKGSYTGLLAPAPGSTGAGSLDVQLTGAGTFTAKLGLNGEAKTLTGSFDSTGHYTGTLDLGNGTSLNVDLQLGLGSDVNAISGTISDGTHTFSINSERSSYSARNPAPQAGYYTVVLPAGTSGTPQGNGYATLKVAANGAVTFTGALQDGTPFSYGGSVSKDGTAGVYFAPYGGKGTVYGVLSFPEVSANDVEGTLSWVKAAGATSDGFYTEGFSTETVVAGSEYKAPRNRQRVVALANTALNAKVTLGEGGINGPVQKSATLNIANRVSVVLDQATETEVGKLKVNIVAPSGLFSGSFVDSTGTQRKFNGVFLQNETRGAGVFRGANSAGYISITAP